MNGSLLPKWNSVGQRHLVEHAEHVRHARAVVADAARRVALRGDAERERAAEAEAHHRRRGSMPSTSARRSSAATQSVDRLREVELLHLRERRAEPGLVVICRPAGREPPEHVGRADHVAGVGEALGDGADVRADAEDLLQQEHRADRLVRGSRGRGPSRRRRRTAPCRSAVSSSPSSLHDERATRSLSGPCAWPTSTTTCPTRRSPRSRSSHATRRRLLVDRGSAAPEHRHVRDLPELLARRRSARRQRLEGDPGAPAPARARPAARPRCCCSSRSTPSAGRGRRSSARRASCRRGEVLVAAGGERVVEMGSRTEAGDTVQVHDPRRRRPL